LLTKRGSDENSQSDGIVFILLEIPGFAIMAAEAPAV